MIDLTDHQLLSEFARGGSEEAFAELVHRHINLVYGAALRQVGNPHAAQDVTQAVFTILAQKAASLSPHTILSGWLYRTTRFASMTTIRTEARREKYERQAAEDLGARDDVSPSWNDLAPVLDEAMDGLRTADRDALLLHFFENKSLREVGVALKTSEDAAQKRISRAIEKLRVLLRRRKVTLSVAALTTFLAATSSQAAPGAMAASIASAATVKAAAESTLLMKGALSLMLWSKIKTGLLSGATALLLMAAILTPVMLNSKGTASPNFAGYWEGSLVGTRTLRLGLNLTNQPDGTYRGTMDSFDQGVRDIPLSSLVITNRTLRVDVKRLKARFEGELKVDGTEISGMFDQGGSLPLVLKRMARPSALATGPAPSDYAPRAGRDLQGYWRTTIDFAGSLNRVALKIAERTDDAPLISIDFLDQGMRNIPAANVKYAAPNLSFDAPGIGSRFHGSFESSSKEISGEWLYGAARSPAVFQRGNPRDDEVKEGDYSFNSMTELPGIWSGVLDIAGNQLRLILKIGRSEGGFIALLDSPEQGLRNIPVSRVTFNKSDLLVELPAARALYTARLQDGKLLGNWQQGDTAYPFNLTRTNTPSAKVN